MPALSAEAAYSTPQIAAVNPPQPHTTNNPPLHTPNTLATISKPPSRMSNAEPRQSVDNDPSDTLFAHLKHTIGAFGKN